ncbi:MAG: hypothetical protein RLZZ387_906 [Chloroflexota bacterium]|jgi:hypothetical protein
MSTAARRMTRESVEGAEPLTFTQPKRSAVVHLAFRGVPVDVHLEEANVAEVEKLITSLAERDGWGVASPSAPTPKAQHSRAPEVTRWGADGSPMCPAHGSPMKESSKAPGTWYCTKKDDAGEYCRCRA